MTGEASPTSKEHRMQQALLSEKLWTVHLITGIEASEEIGKQLDLVKQTEADSRIPVPYV